MKHRRLTRRSIVVLAAVWAAASVVSAARAADCAEWDTIVFFETTTPDEVTACLDAGADPNATGWADETPLHWAATTAGPTFVLMLLEAGADPKARDDDGRTPFDRARDYSALAGTYALQRLDEGRH